MREYIAFRYKQKTCEKKTKMPDRKFAVVMQKKIVFEKNNILVVKSIFYAKINWFHMELQYLWTKMYYL